MNNKQIYIIDQIVNQILKIISGLRQKKLEHKDLSMLYIGQIWTSDYDTEREIYQRLVHQIHETNSEMLSPRIIHEKLLGIIGYGIWNPYTSPPEEEIIEKTRLLVENMIAYEAWRDIDLPVANLEVTDGPFTLGLVTFYPFRESDMTGTWWEWIKADMKGNEIKVQTFARVKTTGDLHIAVRNAVTIVENTLLVLRGVGFPFIENDKPQIATVNNYAPYESRTFRVHKADENVSLEGSATTIAVSNSKYRQPYKLIEQILKGIDEDQIKKLSHILVERNPSKTQNKIHQGLRWIGEATKPDNYSTRFVKLAIALETLIGGHTSKASLAERAAFLLEEDFEQRLKTDEMVRRFYDIRSKIVHEGMSQDITIDDLAIFGDLLRKLVWALIDKIEIFQSINDLQKWVNEMRYK